MKVPREIAYPRRRLVRTLLRVMLTYPLFGGLTRLRIVGRENLPDGGPLMVAINHFHFADAALVVRVVPWPLEVLGGFHNPFAPPWGEVALRAWGYLPVFRGTGARAALRAAEGTLRQGGVLGIAPEGGAWAQVLRPPRPGVAFLAARTGARVLPMGLDGVTDVFPSLARGRRALVTVRIGQLIGPFHVTGRGQERRRQLDEIGHEIMRHIAELIPLERRGFYSDDPAIRAAAKGTEVYPWSDIEEQ
jgi:1-acyl-sn-glycerol-3-phosphate acyltransferase